MPIKSIVHSSGRTFHFGRKRPDIRRRALHWGNYLMKSYKPTNYPAAQDWRPAATASLSRMYLNDQFGCCVIAWGAHREGLWTSNVLGQALVFPDSVISTEYSHFGFDPNNPQATDNGCNEDDANDYWAAHGFAGGVKPAGWMRIDGNDQDQVRGAINEFGAVMVGFEMPDDWLRLFQSLSPDTVLDVAGDPDPNNGHCVGLVGYDNNRYALSSWGTTFYITPGAVKKYCTTQGQGELSAMVTQEWVYQSTLKTPSGIDSTQMLADFNAVNS